MEENSKSILKNPVVSESSNYEWLRKNGLDYIEQLSSAIWTDFNIHDPGITQLEILCYAITDLGYRTSLDVKDLLAEPESKPIKELPERQGFFTAREILTMNPWTNADYRKLLVDIVGVKNAWIKCKACPCEDFYIYAKCSTSTLQYQTTEHPVTIKGLYDVLVEFDTEDATGDLNSGKVKTNFIFSTPTGISRALIEMRLPSWQKLQEDPALYEKLSNPLTEIKSVDVLFISGNKNDNVDIPADQLSNVLRKTVYATIKLKVKPDPSVPGTVTLQLDDVPMKVWFSNEGDRRLIDLAAIKNPIGDASNSGIFGKYLQLIHRADEVMDTTKMILHSHRNLAEDYCTIKAVPVIDVGVCADMEVAPDKDIEAILAEAYFRIDQYMSPEIKFYSLQELLKNGKPVDQIFNGPKLENGFIDNDQLDSTQLKTHIYTSDIINILMDIPGVIAIRNFMLTLFNEEGTLVKNEPWDLEVPASHQPRLYLEASKILVFKNGLPFLPDMLELNDTLQVIKGQNNENSFTAGDNDLPVPKGSYYNLGDYAPVQYGLPLTYGIGYHGLPDNASNERRAQAKQLKAYLMIFEQLLVNYLEQLAHIRDLFAIDPDVKHTYFSRVLKNEDIRGIEDLYNGLTPSGLQDILETSNTFYDRRNRFLDHLMSRFAENFNEYALMLYSYSNSKAIVNDKLIRDKVFFLKDLPFMSANRAKAIQYRDTSLVCNPENISGLELRIKRLLGMETDTGFFELYDETDFDGVANELRWRLKDQTGHIFLSSSTRYAEGSLEKSTSKAKDEIYVVKKYITDPDRYSIKKVKKWVLNLTDETNETIATRKQHFNTKAEAESAREEIIEFGKKVVAADKIYVVEHLLLRPRNKPSLPDFPNGDPLLSICIPDDCSLCGEEDPYSFRLTIVLSGEVGIANSGIEFRRFAEETIRKEIPAHLGVKICWVSNGQLAEFEKVYCDWLSEWAKESPDPLQLHQKLIALLVVFENLKSVYPEARLHDCIDGDDSNRVFLGHTII